MLQSAAGRITVIWILLQRRVNYFREMGFLVGEEGMEVHLHLYWLARMKLRNSKKSLMD